jgi:predicted GNAT superfamily acetyltransferase
MFIVAQKIGGQVIGAWSGELLAGFLLALPGLRHGAEAGPGHAYLHSHMLAVDTEFRNHGLGRRLKLAQRENALSRGIRCIEWTFDPLQPLNAHFNITKLGAIVCRYLPNHYGNSTSQLQAGAPTDRLVAQWWLESPRVLEAMGGEAISSHSEQQVVTERIALPSDLASWRKQGPVAATKIRDAQARTREAFVDAFARGLVVTGFDRHAAGGEYLLSQGNAE